MDDDVVGYSDYDFGPDFEEQVLNVLLLEPNFVAKFRPIIKPEAFLSPNNKHIVETLLGYYDKYEKTPSIEVLVDVVRNGLYRDKGGATQRIESASPVPDTDYVRDRMLLWVKWTTIEQALQSRNGDTPHDFAARVGKAARTGDTLLLDHTLFNEDREGERERSEIIPTPWSWLNRELDGGPEIGDLAVILTVVSGGKTTALVNITRHALRLGKFVVYFTFEDGERKIKSRLMQSIANMTKIEMVSHRAEVRRTRDRFLKKYNGRCEIRDLQSRRSTVSDAAAFVRTLEDNYERKVDVVITDYADRFRPQLRYSEPRHALREIFEDCKWLARNLEVVHWTARQVNKTRTGKEIITIDAAGESYGSMESPDLVIGLGRTLQDEQLDRVVLYTAKVRDEKDHQTHPLVTDFERQRIFDPLDAEYE